MEVLLKPLDGNVDLTLLDMSTAIDVLLSSTLASRLDAGQQEMLREASRRLAQVGEELAADV